MTYKLKKFTKAATGKSHFTITKGCIEVGSFSHEEPAKEFLASLCWAEKYEMLHSVASIVLRSVVGSNGYQYRLVKGCGYLGLYYAIFHRGKILPFWFRDHYHFTHTYATLESDRKHYLKAELDIANDMFDGYVKHGHLETSEEIAKCGV